MAEPRSRPRPRFAPGITAGGDIGMVRVRGVEATNKNIQETHMAAVYVSSLISKRAAHLVRVESQRHVPFDTGELFDSAFVSSVSASFTDDTDPFMGRMPAESLAEYSSRIGNQVIGHTGVIRAGVAVRTFNRYLVGYTADHANIVHETPISYRQGTGPYPSDAKWSHFLLRAYKTFEPQFSAAHRIALEQIIGQIGAKAAKQRNALSSGGGKPRLVKR